MILKTIKEIKAPLELSQGEAQDLVQRIYEMGLRPGVSIQVISKISFGTVTIIQFGQTRLALNEQEFLCLHGPS